MQKITTFLWFNDKAEKAANFYCGIFKNSSIGAITRYGAEFKLNSILLRGTKS